MKNTLRRRYPAIALLASLSLLGAALAEEEPVNGPFTTRLPTTRFYVSGPWEVEAEQFFDNIVPRKGRATQLYQTEIEIGLPGRFQIGVTENLINSPEDRLRHQENVFEARFALASWGKILLNPTIFAEWHIKEDDSDSYELKLLLAQDLGPKWFWALNLSFEHEVGGELESEAGLSQSLLYTLIPSRLRAGVEMTLNRPIERGGHGVPEVEMAIGPSVIWRIVDHAELKVAPLIGLTTHSPRLEIAVLLGIDF